MATAGATKVSAIDAAYYTVTDLDRATKFYNELLGFEPTFTQPGVVSEYTFPGGETFGLYKSDDGIPSGSGVLFAVDDVAAAVAAAKARGVKFGEDGNVTDTPVCRMAFGIDSEGNGFILHRRK